jgi:hypothetical protein
MEGANKTVRPIEVNRPFRISNPLPTKDHTKRPADLSNAALHPWPTGGSSKRGGHDATLRLAFITIAGALAFKNEIDECDIEWPIRTILKVVEVRADGSVRLETSMRNIVFVIVGATLIGKVSRGRAMAHGSRHLISIRKAVSQLGWICGRREMSFTYPGGDPLAHRPARRDR